MPYPVPRTPPSQVASGPHCLTELLRSLTPYLQLSGETAFSHVIRRQRARQGVGPGPDLQTLWQALVS